MKKLLLAKKWDGQDPTGWWMSEKLDGVRAFWDSKKRKLFSRNGNEFDAPDWFTAGFPEHDCDGELYAGRGCFQIAMGIARSKASPAWKKLAFVVFDDCGAGAFEERYERFCKIKRTEYIYVLGHRKCNSEEDLLKTLKIIEDNSGEGLMLRKPKSKYVRSRSSSLLKVKTFSDSEALVIDHIRSEMENHLRAIVCQLPNGITFRIGSGFTDCQRAAFEPAIGSTITFKHQDYTDAGVPRFATFLRVRELLKGELA